MSAEISLAIGVICKKYYVVVNKEYIRVSRAQFKKLAKVLNIKVRLNGNRLALDER